MPLRLLHFCCAPSFPCVLCLQLFLLTVNPRNQCLCNAAQAAQDKLEAHELRLRQLEQAVARLSSGELGGQCNSSVV
jgi:hypothetical protein